MLVVPAAILLGAVAVAPAAAGLFGALLAAPAARLCGEASALSVLWRFVRSVCDIFGGNRADQDAPRPSRKECKAVWCLQMAYGEGLSKGGNS